MQMPILTYPHFSQFLHLHQQQQLQRQYSRAGLDTTTASETSTESSSPSPSPPLSATDTKSAPSKSFTIDAILGLRDDSAQDSLFHPAFHHRLQVPDLSRLSGVLGGNEHASTYVAVRPSDKNDGPKKCAGKSKRVRTIFTPEQLERLEAEFERQQYMVGPERLYLAHTLQLTEAQVKVWFQNRRIKWRKQHLELQQQRLAAIKQRQRADPDDSADSDDSSAGRYPVQDLSAPQAATVSAFVGVQSASAGFPTNQASGVSYRYDDNQSSRESLANQDDEFV